jgi:chromosome segregation ATPase
MQTDWLVYAPTTALLSAVTWAVARWWYRRQLAALSLRLHQMDKARQSCAAQTVQARRQLEKLQHELSQSRRAASQAAAQREKVQRLHAVLQAAPPEATPQRGAASPDGFADTLPM